MARQSSKMVCFHIDGIRLKASYRVKQLIGPLAIHNMERAYIILATAVLTCVGVCDGNPDMKRLLDDLFVRGGYMPDVRPVFNESDTVNVEIGLSLFSFRYNENSETLESRVLLQYAWRDRYLAWVPDEFGGIQNFRISPHRLWKPDIVLYNSVSPNMDLFRDALAVVSSDGSVMWLPSARLITECPYDNEETVCSLKFGSWTYDGYQLDINSLSNGVDLSSYMINRDWEIFDATLTRHVLHYVCCPEPYPDLTAQLSFRKRRGKE